MPKRIVFPFAFIVASILATASFADVGWPDQCYGEIAYEGSEIVLVYTVPDGSGDPFTEARTSYGGIVDATLTLHLRNAAGDPVAGYPAEDMWLVTTAGNLVACPGGTCADGPSDATGAARWTQPLHAGGTGSGLLQMVIGGYVLFDTPGYPVNIVTPDLNGDLRIDLVDVGLFAQDFATLNAPLRSDFHRDGVINIGDVARLAEAYGTTCP